MKPRPIDIATIRRGLPGGALGVILWMSVASGAGPPSISLVPTTSVTNVQPGDTVTFDIVMDFTGDPSIGGGLDILFDSGALQFVSFSSNGAFGDPAFHRDPDVLDGQLRGWCDGNFNGLPETGTLGSVEFEVLPTIGAATDLTAADDGSECGPWFSFATFQVILTTYNGFTVESLDTDGDDNPDHTDPDDDNDAVGDELDTSPLVANNLCTSSDGDVATMAETIVGDRMCAAKTLVDIEGLTRVLGGHLTVIAPLIQARDGVEVDGEMTAINADPCSGC